jgi:hypothetical protein
MVMPGLSVPECLPPLRKNEREIARIALRSVQADQISVRARRKGDRIVYSIVDEYEDQAESQYKLHPASSRSPLPMRQLVAMLDGACDRGGAVMCHVVYSVEVEKERAEDQYGYVSVWSDFYPELRAYYEARIDQYCRVHSPHFTFGSSQTPGTNLFEQAGAYPALPVFLPTKRVG